MYALTSLFLHCSELRRGSQKFQRRGFQGNRGANRRVILYCILSLGNAYDFYYLIKVFWERYSITVQGRVDATRYTPYFRGSGMNLTWLF